MTKLITVLHGQSIPDLALQYYGVIDGMNDIANLNDISITERLVPGQQLLVTVTTNETTKYLGSYKDKITHVIAATDDKDVYDPDEFSDDDFSEEFN